MDALERGLLVGEMATGLDRVVDADVLMLVRDGSTGLPDAVTAVWPRTVVRTCVVHLPRNSFRYAGRQHRDVIAKALKPACTVPTEAAARERFAEFTDTWDARYPAIVRLWGNAWAEFVPFLAFGAEIRRVICSTSAIESVNVRIIAVAQLGRHVQPALRALATVAGPEPEDVAVAFAA